VSETTSTTVYNEKLESVRSDWVPLARAPFEFRNVIQGGVVRPGTPDEVLCEWIMRPSTNIGDIVRSVGLDRTAGTIELTFSHTNPNGSHPRMGLHLPAVKHNIQFFRALTADISANPLHLRNLHTALRNSWSRMEKEFHFAVRCGACIVFARRGAYDAARFTRIPADIFLAHTNVDWGRNECTGPDGMKLFSVHCAGTERVPTSRDPVSSPSKRCESWLTNQMRETPRERPKPKSEFRTEAQQVFGISGNEFDSIWAVAIEKTGANWSKPGAPKKSNARK
jgi:hypothetical protein